MKTVRSNLIEYYIHIVFLLLTVVYLISICLVNLNGQQWYEYDIYADAMLAKYIAESGSLFPKTWTFGNQLYVFATPTVAAAIYLLCEDPILSISISSCIMTFLSILLFTWCIYPFTSKQGRIIGIFCIAGGVILGTSAANDSTSMQLFYTMASYYACYLIGIFYTIGIWIRIYLNRSVSRYSFILCIAINFALGIQSLRELLVLSLPLCTLSLLISLWYKQNTKINNTYHLLFSFGTLGASLLGNAIRVLLSSMGKISQITILEEVSHNLVENISKSFHSFITFIGLTLPNTSIKSICIFCMSAFLACFVVITLADIIYNKKFNPLTCMIIYCVISLTAVFLAGILFINLRPHYYFVWRILSTLCIVYLAEKNSHSILQILFLLTVLFTGFSNYIISFGSDILRYSDDRKFYCSMVNQLEKDGISHIYYDNYSTFEAPIIGALSEPHIICGTFFMNKDNFNPDNMLRQVNYLQSKDWFSTETISNCYFLISDKRWNALAEEKYTTYRESLHSHLTLIYDFNHNGKNYYFYKGDADLLLDLKNN